MSHVAKKYNCLYISKDEGVVLIKCHRNGQQHQIEHMKTYQKSVAMFNLRHIDRLPRKSAGCLGRSHRCIL